MKPDAWSDGAAYDGYIGRWSRPVAAQFIHWLSLPPGGAWLDLGCGTGALSQAILAYADPRLVLGCDRSSDYVSYAAARTRNERARFVVADLPDLPRIDGGFDAVTAGLVLNFLATPLEGVRAMKATTRPGGVVAAYLWDYAEEMQMLRVFWDAACALDLEARGFDEGIKFPLCHPEPLRQLFDEAGLQTIEITSLTTVTVFTGFDDFWTPFQSGQGPAPGYVSSLAPEHRERLREGVRSRLSPAADGSIHLTARAWAAKGTVP